MAALTTHCLFGGLGRIAISRPSLLSTVFKLSHFFKTKVNSGPSLGCDEILTSKAMTIPCFHFQSRSMHTSSSNPRNGRFHNRTLKVDEVDWSKMSSLNNPYKHSFDPLLVEKFLEEASNDLPVSNMPDPFEKNYRRCFLCKNDVHLDHKNVRLLSQFVSPFTGRIYGRAITGLCIPMQKRVASLIKRSRMSGYMPYLFKEPKYLQDPQPYDAASKTRQ